MNHPDQQVRRARMLLELDDNAPAETDVPSHLAVAAWAGVCTDTVVKLTKEYVERGGDVRGARVRLPTTLPPVLPMVNGEFVARMEDVLEV